MPSSSRLEPLGTVALWAARAALLGAAGWAPWTWGGVLPGERAVACGLTALAAALALIGVTLGGRGVGRVPLFAVPLAGLAAIGGLQLLGGPADALGPLAAPHPGGEVSRWAPVTVAAPLTRAATADAACGLAAAVLGAVLCSTVAPRRLACWAIAGVAGAVAFFGAATLVRPEVGLFADPDVGKNFGPFVNRNNACGLLSCGLAAAAALAADPALGRRRAGLEEPDETARSFWSSPPRLGAAGLAALCAAGAIASGSRGGALAVLVVLAAGLAAVRVPDRLRRRSPLDPTLLRLGAAAGTLAAALGLVVWLDLLGRLTDRLAGPSAGLADLGAAGRGRHWADVLPAVPDRGPWGFGLGTYRHAHLPYEDQAGSTTHRHADGMPVEWLLEVGAIGTLAVVVAGLLAGAAAWRRAFRNEALRAAPRSAPRLPAGPLSAAGLGGVALLAGLATNAAFDFGVTLPGVFLPAGVLLGALCAARPCGADFAAEDDPDDPPADPVRRAFRESPPPPRPRRRPVRRIPVRGAKPRPVPPPAAPPIPAPPPPPRPAPRTVRPRVAAAVPPDPPADPVWRRALTAAALLGLAAGTLWGWDEHRGAAAVAAVLRSLPDRSGPGPWDEAAEEAGAAELARLRAALERRPHDSAGWLALARVHRARYRRRAAARLAGPAPELSEAERWRLTDPAALHRLARQIRAAGGDAAVARLRADPLIAADLPAAAEALARAAAVHPWHPALDEPRAELAFLAEPGGTEGEPRDPDGIERLRHGHLLLHGRPGEQAALGRLAWSAGDAELAAACWRRALELDPGPGRLRGIAARLRPEPDWPGNFLAVLPDDPATLAAAATLTGDAGGRRGDPGDAAEAPGDGESRAFLDRLFPTADLAPPPAAARELERRAVALLDGPGVAPRVRASAFATLDRHAEARAAYGEMLRTDPLDPDGRLQFARYLLTRGEFEEAAAQARDARALLLAAGAPPRAADRLLAQIARARRR